MGRGAACQNQRPDADVEQAFGEKAVLNRRMGGPEDSGGQACLQYLGPSLLRCYLFAPLRFPGALERDVRRHGHSFGDSEFRYDTGEDSAWWSGSPCKILGTG